MNLYHGTTERNARNIARNGFLPRAPSRAVWFTTSRSYARRRAQQKANRAKEHAIVLHCDLQIPQLREQLGTRMTIKGGVIAVRGHLPPTVVHSYSTSKNSKRQLAISLIASPQKLNMWVSEQLVVWVNDLLGLKQRRKTASPGSQCISGLGDRSLRRESRRCPEQRTLRHGASMAPRIFRGR